MNVLSHHHPDAVTVGHASLTAARSVSCIIGLVGVSRNSMRVRGVKARLDLVGTPGGDEGELETEALGGRASNRR